MPAENPVRPRWLPRGVGLLLVVSVVAVGAVLLGIFGLGGAEDPAPAAAPAVPEKGVACLGRLEPEDGVIDLAAPYFAGRPSVVRELRVREGDGAKAGQVLAVLDGHGPAEAAVRQGETRLLLAQRRLARVQAGEKPGDIAAQRAELARREAETDLAETELRRYDGLYRDGDVSASQIDEKRTQFETSRRMLEAARSRLDSVTEVRKADIDVASAEVASALADLERARAERELTEVRAPVSGRVLTIHARAGEQATPVILTLGKDGPMYVVAEVYETDIGGIRRGQRATIQSDLFPDVLQGTVTEIGFEIAKSEVLPLDPAAFADARVIHVKVRLDESDPVAGLVHGKVSVVFRP